MIMSAFTTQTLDAWAGLTAVSQPVTHSRIHSDPPHRSHGGGSPCLDGNRCVQSTRRTSKYLYTQIAKSCVHCQSLSDHLTQRPLHLPSPHFHRKELPPHPPPPRVQRLVQDEVGSRTRRNAVPAAVEPTGGPCVREASDDGIWDSCCPPVATGIISADLGG